MIDGAAFNTTRIATRLALTGLVGVWLSACSSDSTRLSESLTNPFANPFSTASNDAAPAQPLASNAPSQANLAVAAHTSPVAVSALPPQAPPTTGAIKNAEVQTVAINGWRAAGGSPIIVADKETVEILSRRYGVPVVALLKVNGFASASEVHAGTRLIVPVYDSTARTADASTAASRKDKRGAEVADAAPAKASKADKKQKKADELADAKADAADARSQDKVKTAKKDLAREADKPLADAKPAPLVAQNDPAAKPASGKKKPLVADNATTGSVHAEDPAPTAALTGAQADAAGVSPEFRWPARGRIIQGFKTGGNDGINIAVPEGTSVKAAESGVVAYAGSELKGYGNLVLIRHPNGFVSAYANNGELDVKRGETVKRGQIIAKSGQSGNVNSPQLHFELRKGSTPVDPTSYLAGL
jgi:murein DD-endopeptidase MepM/ murein hydrolase activator NlpD